MNIDHLLVYHCAPTLAGLKMAALICVPDRMEGTDYRSMVAYYNMRYNKRGLIFRTIGQCKDRHLLYIYRADALATRLADEKVKEFLQSYGYHPNSTLDEKISHLSERFRKGQEFPHEFGVFLDYPLEDVEGFIRYRGKESKLCGEWVVYGDETYARQQFKKYNVCRKCYVDMFNRGFTVDRLIIA